MSATTITPPCGLYRTTRPLPTEPEAVPAGRLVMFHNHSDQGPPILLLPQHNRHNRWSFHERGFLVEDAAFMSSLEALKAEGWYFLREHFHPNQQEVVPQRQLVQLGYNAHGEAILFFPELEKDRNALFFSDKGMKIPATIYALLEPLATSGPQVPKAGPVKH